MSPDFLEEAEALMASGRGREAADLLRTRLEEGRGGIFLRLLYARALLVCGDVEAALVASRETALLYPDAAPAALGLGEVLRAGGALPVAIAEFQRALRLDPELDEARLKLGEAWLDAGEAEKAMDAFAVLDRAMPGLAESVAACEAMRARPRSDAGYVRHLFDQFSADYDARMRKALSYQAPEILAELAALVLPGRKNLSVLDLGCGTGLCGEVFKPLARRLDGIDLSPAMIEKAKARGIYDTLAVGDIESLPAAGAYDLVLAADTLVYLGDLAPVMGAVARAVRPGGSFLFTTEAKQGEGFELGPKRRWRHSEAYLRAQAEAGGYAIIGLVECTPRREAGSPVAGLAAAFLRGI